MPRTKIPDHLVHRPEDLEENARLFDTFVELIEIDPQELQNLLAADLLEKIRQKVLENGEFKLPFGLVIKKA